MVCRPSDSVFTFWPKRRIPRAIVSPDGPVVAIRVAGSGPRPPEEGSRTTWWPSCPRIQSVDRMRHGIVDENGPRQIGIGSQPIQRTERLLTAGPAVTVTIVMRSVGLADSIAIRQRLRGLGDQLADQVTPFAAAFVVMSETATACRHTCRQTPYVRHRRMPRDVHVTEMVPYTVTPSPEVHTEYRTITETIMAPESTDVTLRRAAAAGLPADQRLRPACEGR